MFRPPTASIYNGGKQLVPRRGLNHSYSRFRSQHVWVWPARPKVDVASKAEPNSLPESSTVAEITRSLSVLDARNEHIARLKRKIDDGTYCISAFDLAEKLLLRVMSE